MADGSYWLYIYDQLGQVISGHKFWSDGTPVAGQQFDYAFDTIGYRTSTLAGGDQNGLNQRSASYTANSLNQYTQRTVPGDVDVMGTSYATNTVTVNGNTAYRKVEYFRDQLPVNNGSSALWTNIIVAATGQTSVTGNVFVAQSSENFGYDADGNMTNDGRWVFTWDGENRVLSLQGLVAIPTGAKFKLDFLYDPQGRRIQKVVSTNSGSAYYPLSTNRFLYDGWNLVATFNSQSSILQSFMWGTDLSGSLQGAGGVGGLLEIYDTVNGTHFAGFDGNANLVALVKGIDGSVAASYEYGPFGEAVRSTGPTAKASPYRFSTKYQDDESDFLYYGYRYYSATAGRWTSRDPIEEGGGTHLYACLGNDGLNEVDDLGLCGGGGQDCSCGPDVTRYVPQSVNDIIQTFRSVKSKWQKRSACGRILRSPNSSWNWDVLWLQSTPNTGAKCSQCSLTFTYNGKCYKQYALWYFLYGVAADECTRAFPGFRSPDPIDVLAAGLVARMPISGDTLKQVRNKVEVAEHWYRSTRLSNQEPECPAAVGREPARKPDPTYWRWKGIKWIDSTH